MEHVRILYFGPARERTGRDEEDIEVKPGTTVADIREDVRERFPDMSEFIDACRIAVDMEYVPDEHPVRSGSELALIPPVAGG
jgi:molybdopterin converting factor subunit 1